MNKVWIVTNFDFLTVLINEIAEFTFKELNKVKRKKQNWYIHTDHQKQNMIIGVTYFFGTVTKKIIFLLFLEKYLLQSKRLGEILGFLGLCISMSLSLIVTALNCGWSFNEQAKCFSNLK